MADYNVDEISELVKNDILAESQGVGEVEVVTSLTGINSLPALKDGNTVVEAPLSLLSKPAEDAAEEAREAIGNAETATTSALSAATAANEAAQSVTDAILDLQEEKKIIADVATAEQTRIANENERNENESERLASEQARKDTENARVSAENARNLAEIERVEAENLRVEAESARASAENVRNTQEQSRVSAEDVRKSNEVARENVKAEMVALNTELKNHPPQINSEMNWEIWDAVNKVYVDTGITAQGKSPVIIDGIWWLWDDDADAYVSSGWAVNTDFELTRDGIEGVLGGSPMVYIEEWKHTDVPYKMGMQVRFNQEFYIALRETSVAPIPLFEIEEGVYAKVSETEYATVGCYEADGNKEDWKKIPYDELRLTSREGTLNGEAVNVDDLSGEEVYQFEPNLYIDFKKGTINGIKASELIGRIKRIEEKLGL